jgi:hypothetical protein
MNVPPVVKPRSSSKRHPKLFIEHLLTLPRWAAWLIPGQMTGKIYEFDLCVGGGYRMSLFYLSSDAASGVSTKHYS